MWETPLIAWHLITDVMIFLAYMVLPFCIMCIILMEVGKRHPLLAPLEKSLDRIKYPPGIPWVERLQHLGWLGALFIGFCGFGHLIDAVGIWYALPWFKAVWNTGTALSSWAAGIATVRHFPYFTKLIRQVEQFRADNA
jgi:hypothetical protein